MVETMTRTRGEDPSATPPALVVDHLTKRFGERIAFEDVSFSVAQGEVFGFLGPNGAGKTTTVRTLGTLIAPTSGSASGVGSVLVRRVSSGISRSTAPWWGRLPTRRQSR
jgi:ABC-2 type transport system ATP-binding protein